MAIVAETFVPRATRAQADQFDASVDATMAARGGPPDGLMVHFARPEGDGFVLCNVWRTEAEMKAFLDSVIVPRLEDVGLSWEAPKVSPVWVFARP